MKMEEWMVNDDRGHGRIEGLGGWQDMEEWRIWKNGGYRRMEGYGRIKGMGGWKNMEE